VRVLIQYSVITFRATSMAHTDIDAISKNTYNFYLVIEVSDHVYVLVGKIEPIHIKDIYMIRYFYHKIEIIRVFFHSGWAKDLSAPL
jgi:hypothetical protein